VKTIGSVFVIVLILALAQPAWCQNSQTLTGHRPTAEQRSDADQFGSALRNLIESHPSVEVSHDLDSLIINKVIWLAFQPLAEINAYGQNAIASFALVRVDEKKIVPVLMIDPETLMDPYAPVEYQQLVIFHEYQHYKQWQTKKYPERLFMAWGPTEVLTRAEAIGFYQSEVEAYEAECELAGFLDWGRYMPICLPMQDQVSFRLSIAHALMADPKMKQHETTILALAGQGR
jgi:hypothetical protein